MEETKKRKRQDDETPAAVVGEVTAAAGSGSGSGSGAGAAASMPTEPDAKQPPLKKAKTSRDIAIARLTREFAKMTEDKKQEFKAELVNPDDLFVWLISFKLPDVPVKVGTEIKMEPCELQKKINEQTTGKRVTLLVTVPDTYPFDAPRVYVSSPRFSYGHLWQTQGIVCTDLLTVAGWSSATNMTAIALNFQTVIASGKYELDSNPDTINVPYDPKDSKETWDGWISGHSSWMQKVQGSAKRPKHDSMTSW